MDESRLTLTSEDAPPPSRRGARAAMGGALNGNRTLSLGNNRHGGLRRLRGLHGRAPGHGHLRRHDTRPHDGGRRRRHTRPHPRPHAAAHLPAPDIRRHKHSRGADCLPHRPPRLDGEELGALRPFHARHGFARPRRLHRLGHRHGAGRGGGRRIPCSSSSAWSRASAAACCATSWPGRRRTLFRKHVYASASILGALLCTALLAVNETLALALGMAATVVIRLLAAAFRWNLPHAGKSAGNGNE